MPGMKWSNAVSLVHGSINLRGIPKVVLLHCGGNDIGDVPCGAVSPDEIYNYNCIEDAPGLFSDMVKYSSSSFLAILEQ